MIFKKQHEESFTGENIVKRKIFTINIIAYLSCALTVICKFIFSNPNVSDKSKILMMTGFIIFIIVLSIENAGNKKIVDAKVVPDRIIHQGSKYIRYFSYFVFVFVNYLMQLAVLTNDVFFNKMFYLAVFTCVVKVLFNIYL
jgi:hypothetical protein